MILTREWLQKNTRGTGSINKKQTDLLGLSWPPEKGWLSRLVGTEIDDAKAAKFSTLQNPKGNAQAKPKKQSPNLVEEHREEAFKSIPAWPRNAKYVVVGGFAHIGEEFVYWKPETVAEKYGFDLAECILVDSWQNMPTIVPEGSKLLQIRFDGDWGLGNG